jgi:hypothetical protein
MSQENQNIQPSSDSQTQQSSSQENPPFWKALLIKALRGTIGLLETTAVKLETESSPGSREKPSFLQKLQQGWSGILRKIRLILPAQFSTKLSDTALSGILSGITLTVFLITSNLFADKPSQIAIATSNTEVPPVVSSTKPESVVLEEQTASLPPESEIITEQQQEIGPVIEQKNSTQEEQTVSLPPESEVITEQQQEIGPIIEQKNSTQEEQTVSLPPESEVITEQKEIGPVIEQKTFVEEETITEQQEEISVPQELQTTPTLLTPEEALIATIQNQVAEISDSQIIESIQANFLNSNLTIKISNDWYSLEKTQQDKLAADILQRSQELDFNHLEITDLKGKLLARNPVIGTEMIVFKRK